MSPPKVTKIDDLSHAIQAWENLERRHWARIGDQLPKDMRLAILLSMCPTDLEKQLTAQQHLFLDFAQMRAHIVTVINSRTHSTAPMMIGNVNDAASSHVVSSDELVESEDGELYRLEIRNRKKVFTKPRRDSSKGNTKGGGNGRTDKECFRCGRIGHIRADCRAKTHLNGGPPKSAPKRKIVGSCEEEDPLGDNRFWGPLRCCQITVTPQKIMWMLMNPHKKLQILCHHCHLFPGSRRQRLQSILRCIAGSF